MTPDQPAQFKIWGVDQVVYGPVDLPTLVAWVQDDRVTADTWLFRLPPRCMAQSFRVAGVDLYFSPE